jgi:phytoene dehydrogenase-like protein
LAAAQSVYARVAPPGAALVHTVKWLDPHQPADSAADERDLEGLLDAVQPGWRDLVVKRFFLPRIAAVGALPLAARGGFAGRPDAAVRGLAGLYLAGDWVGAEGFLVDASAASARQAVRAILARPRAERGTRNERRLLLSASRLLSKEATPVGQASESRAELRPTCVAR